MIRVPSFFVVRSLSFERSTSLVFIDVVMRRLLYVFTKVYGSRFETRDILLDAFERQLHDVFVQVLQHHVTEVPRKDARFFRDVSDEFVGAIVVVQIVCGLKQSYESSDGFAISPNFVHRHLVEIELVELIEDVVERSLQWILDTVRSLSQSEDTVRRFHQRTVVVLGVFIELGDHEERLDQQHYIVAIAEHEA